MFFFISSVTLNLDKALFIDSLTRVAALPVGAASKIFSLRLLELSCLAN